MPVNCTRADTTPSCDITKVADGTCDPGCMSPECLFDGGDCANTQIAKSFPRDLRQTFTLLDAHLSPDTDDQDSSWLDSTPDAFIDSTRRRCDDAESWTKTETILEDVDMKVHDSSNFGGFDFSVLAELINVPKSNSKYPRAANGDKVEFRASVSLGCDQYEKELKENLFKFYTPTEFRYFLNEMRKLTGSDIFGTEETVPYEWTCDHSYYGTGGCVSSGHEITLATFPRLNCRLNPKLESHFRRSFRLFTDTFVAKIQTTRHNHSHAPRTS